MKRLIVGLSLVVMAGAIAGYLWLKPRGSIDTSNGLVPATEASQFLFRGQGFRLNLYTDENTFTEVGILPASQRESAQVIADRYVYFIDAYNGISIFELSTKQVMPYPIPDLQLGVGGVGGVADFLVEGQDIYYLKGVCSEGFSPCDLMRFDSGTAKNELIVGYITSGPVCGVSIDKLDAATNSLFINHGCGDAGVALFDRMRVDLLAKTITTIGSYNSRYCGEDNEYCDAEQLRMNAEYDANVSFPTKATCGGVTLDIGDKGQFVSCL